MRPSDRAWLTLAVGVAIYDRYCPPGETLSAATRRYHRARPWTTRVVIVYLGMHLLGWIKDRADPLTWLPPRR